MGTPGWEWGQMAMGTWQRLAPSGETWLRMGTEGRGGAWGPLTGNGDRWAHGGRGDSCVGGEEHGAMWSPLGSCTPEQLRGYLSRHGGTWEGRGVTLNAVTPLRQGTARGHDHRQWWEPGPSGRDTLACGWNHLKV